MSGPVMVENLCIYDPDFKSVADAFVEDSGTASAARSVKNMMELELALNGFMNVKFVEFVIHGSPGMFHFNDGMGMMGGYMTTLCKNPLFLAKNARILFDNCNIGEGAQGNTFMDAIGSGLLIGKGGTVGASTVTNVCNMITGKCYLNPLWPSWFKVRRYDTAGKKIGSMDVDRNGNVGKAD
jgi:hypothetical protein